jgi:phosphate-selective porin OprO/OprP
MRKSLAILTALLMLSVFSFTALADDEKPTEEIEVGGRFMLDMAWMSGDDAIEEEFGPFEDAIEYRRARLYAKGTFFGKVEFKVQYDFAGGDADWKDVYLKIKHLPFNLTVGHFKEPFGLEELTSSKYITFIEQSLISDTFAPSRKLGFMFDINLADKLIWLGLGIFREPTDSYGNALNVEALYNFTGRFAITPLYDKKTGNTVHLGVAYTSRNLDGGELRYRARPEVHVTAHRFVDTGKMYAETSNIFGIEAAAVFGPFSIQGEFMSASIDATMVGDPVFSGFYIQASYWLTGEHRNYKASSKVFDRVKPKNSLGQKDGIGAFELALRYSMLDLNDADITGSELNNFTVGLNWHLNPYTRIMANYVMSDHDEYGAFNCFYLRFQTDFKIKVSK